MRQLITLFLWCSLVAEGSGPRFRLATHSYRIAPFFLDPIALFTVGSGTVTLNSSNPDGSASVATSTTWGAPIGILSDRWNMTIAAGSSSFTNCPLVALGAVMITCTSVAITGVALGGTSSACSAPFPLSTMPQALAGGTDGVVLSAIGLHTINLNIGFTDSWRYPATTSACTLSLNYSLSVQ